VLDHAVKDFSSILTVEKKVSWNGLRVVHYRARHGELSEHAHLQHQVIIPLSGSFEGVLHTAAGTNANGRVAVGSVCILPARSRHAAYFPGEAEYLSLYIEPALVARAGGASPAEIVEQCVADPIINQIGMALRAELASEGLNGQLYAESLANVLAVHLLRHYSATRAVARPFTGGLTAYKLRRTLDFISDNLERHISLGEIATQVGMSSFHFAREFKKATGLAPHQYLIHKRVERAKLLLAQSQLPIVEISLRTGFTNQSHFTRLFRKLTSITPAAFRETAR